MEHVPVLFYLFVCGAIARMAYCIFPVTKDNNIKIQWCDHDMDSTDKIHASGDVNLK